MAKRNPVIPGPTHLSRTVRFVTTCGPNWKEPGLKREFRVPAVEVVSSLGVLTCALMIFGLGWPNWIRLGVWLIVGLFIYFGYGIKHSKLRASTSTQGIAPVRAKY